MRKYSPPGTFASLNPAPPRPRRPLRTDRAGNLLPTSPRKHLRLAALSSTHHEEFLRRKAARRTEGRA